MFHRIWSGHVVQERDARMLLSLIDQIHLWAITEYRTFIIEHLRPWHQLCDQNYLLEWDSCFDVPEHKKRKRAADSAGNLTVPSWVSEMKRPNRNGFRNRARLSLEEAIQRSNLIGGGFASQDEIYKNWMCLKDGCGWEGISYATLLDHIKREHNEEDRNLAKLRQLIRDEETKMAIRERQERGILTTGYRWGGPREEYPFTLEDSTGSDFYSNDCPQRRKPSGGPDLDPL